MVAGSTTSAKSQVSVQRCSSTTVNRSARRRPARSRVWSGAVAAGLALKTTSDVTGGSASPVSAAASRLMLIDRAGGAGMSGGRTTGSSSTGWWPLVVHERAAARVPEVAGDQRQRADRPDRLAGAVVPLRARARPGSRWAGWWRSARRAGARRRRRARTRRRPAPPATRRAALDSSGQPTVCASSQSRSAAPGVDGPAASARGRGRRPCRAAARGARRCAPRCRAQRVDA